MHVRLLLVSVIILCVLIIVSIFFVQSRKSGGEMVLKNEHMYEYAAMEKEAQSSFLKHWSTCGDVHQTRFMDPETRQNFFIRIKKPLSVGVLPKIALEKDGSWSGEVHFSTPVAYRSPFLIGGLGREEPIFFSDPIGSAPVPFWFVRLKNTKGVWHTLEVTPHGAFRPLRPAPKSKDVPIPIFGMSPDNFSPEPCDFKYL